jgi:hypothetical protein
MYVSSEISIKWDTIAQCLQGKILFDGKEEDEICTLRQWEKRALHLNIMDSNFSWKTM